MINRNRPRVQAYHALPDAIPETKWLVVPVDAEGSPIYANEDEWVVVAEHATHEAAAIDAVNRTIALQFVTF